MSWKGIQLEFCVSCHRVVLFSTFFVSTSHNFCLTQFHPQFVATCLFFVLKSKSNLNEQEKTKGYK